MKHTYTIIVESILKDWIEKLSESELEDEVVSTIQKEINTLIENAEVDNQAKIRAIFEKSGKGS